jgi:hypothetical protein
MIPDPVEAIITRDPGSSLYDIQLEGTAYRTTSITRWGARRAARKMIRQYVTWGGRYFEVVTK